MCDCKEIRRQQRAVRRFLVEKHLISAEVAREVAASVVGCCFETDEDGHAVFRDREGREAFRLPADELRLALFPDEE